MLHFQLRYKKQLKKGVRRVYLGVLMISTLLVQCDSNKRILFEAQEDSKFSNQSISQQALLLQDTHFLSLLNLSARIQAVGEPLRHMELLVTFILLRRNIIPIHFGFFYLLDGCVSASDRIVGILPSRRFPNTLKIIHMVSQTQKKYILSKKPLKVNH